MPVSPRTQALMQPPPTEADAVSAFEEGFSQLAHRVFTSKYPELVESTVTFRVLSSDLETGSGTGAFVLSRDGETLFVPVILARNQVKPLDVLYYKDKDIFLPLSKDWIREISRGALDHLGQPAKPSKTMMYNEDIRDLVVPPTIGRYAYAAAGDPGIRLAQFLSQAPNFVKKAFAIALRHNKKIMKFAFENFDKDMLLEALKPHQEKKAAAPKVELLSADSPLEKFEKIFGKNAGIAYQEAIKKGYVILDQRTDVTNRALEVDGPLWLTSIEVSGFYSVYLADGTQKKALVLVNPQCFESPVYAGKRTDLKRYPDPYMQRHKRPSVKVVPNEDKENFDEVRPDYTSGQKWYLIYTEDGKVIETDRTPLGKVVHLEFVKGKLMEVLSGDPSPIRAGRGFFVQLRGGKLLGTRSVEISNVTTGSDGIRRAQTLCGKTLITDPADPIKQLVAPRGQGIAYVPSSYRFVPAEMDYGIEIMKGSLDTLPHIARLEKVGAMKIKLKDAGMGMFSVGGLPSEPKLATLETLVVGMNLPLGDAEALLDKTSSEGKAVFYLVNKDQLAEFRNITKQAQGMPEQMPPEAMQQGMAPPESLPPDQGAGMPAGMLPEMMGLPPEMGGMPPPPPPPPNPVEMAVDEVGSQVVQQSADISQQLATQQQELANKMEILQAVKDRAAQIHAEMNGLPPPPSSGAQVFATPPAGPGAMPAPEALPPGAMPPPGMEGPPPAPMPEAGPEVPPEELAGAMSPAMQQAADLEDAKAFEATALGSMIANTNLRGSISDYIPTLEESLDNLGRILMTLWMEEDTFREDMGDDDFAKLEQNLLTVFKNLGDLILKINQTALPVVDNE